MYNVIDHIIDSLQIINWRSENLERMKELSICVTDVEKVGGWNILTEDNEWVKDETFSVKCLHDSKS